MPKIDWDNIDTVLLDMDGTLIDRQVEDIFWGETVPKIYAKKLNLPIDEAKLDFHKKSMAKEHLPDWGNVNVWEKDLGVKLWPARKKALSKVGLHPHTIRFLKFLKKREKKVYLVTASDVKDTKIKLTVTKMLGYFDRIYTQPELGQSKSRVEFWEKLHKKLGFDKNRTLLADDNINVLNAAEVFGIKWLIFKMLHSSVKPAHEPRENLLCVRHFDDVLKD